MIPYYQQCASQCTPFSMTQLKISNIDQNNFHQYWFYWTFKWLPPSRYFCGMSKSFSAIHPDYPNNLANVRGVIRASSILPRFHSILLTPSDPSSQFSSQGINDISYALVCWGMQHVSTRRSMCSRRARQRQLVNVSYIMCNFLPPCLWNLDLWNKNFE